MLNYKHIAYLVKLVDRDIDRTKEKIAKATAEDKVYSGGEDAGLNADIKEFGDTLTLAQEAKLAIEEGINTVGYGFVAQGSKAKVVSEAKEEGLFVEEDDKDEEETK